MDSKGGMENRNQTRWMGRGGHDDDHSDGASTCSGEDDEEGPELELELLELELPEALLGRFSGAPGTLLLDHSASSEGAGASPIAPAAPPSASGSSDWMAAMLTSP
mgnify:CR=1 FL=1